jgi:hypothetical protein
VKENCSHCITTNHKVVSVSEAGCADVYGIQVDSDHNYAISAGVFVKNTVFEIGYACFANKVIIGVTMIEGQINLMLAQAAVRYCHSPEELAETLKDIIPLLSPGRDDDSLDAYAETHRYGGSVQ